ncbi:MAG TPA: class I SAM-dependent methyltransferase [Longimicrobiaceae bacterium]|nr:class I SAM-dependent methyltransferase [Longimicrobiaceae bacterium]
MNDPTVFGFGRNWQRYLDEAFSEERVGTAVASLRTLLGARDLAGRTFLDIGCGSGLFSLAAHRLGARVTSFDVDDDSVACARRLHEREGRPATWTVGTGSVLDEAFLAALPRADVVYSWGVLHHTGAMWPAIANAAGRVAPGGTFAIGIYNRLEGRRGSDAWARLKRWYCRAPRWQAALWENAYVGGRLLRMAVVGRNPVRYVREYRQNRGMSWRRDVTDWLGGYPYEAATPGQVLEFVRERFGYALVRQNVNLALGVSEFVFEAPPAVAAARPAVAGAGR